LAAVHCRVLEDWKLLVKEMANFSRGSTDTDFSCDRITIDGFITDSLLSLGVKEFLKWSGFLAKLQLSMHTPFDVSLTFVIHIKS